MILVERIETREWARLRIVLSKALLAAPTRARPLRNGSTGIDARLRREPISPRAGLIRPAALPTPHSFPACPSLNTIGPAPLLLRRRRSASGSDTDAPSLQRRRSRPCRGGARAAIGKCSRSAMSMDRSRCARMRAMRCGSSRPAITRSLPWQRAQVSISIPNTRFRRCAQLIATCFTTRSDLFLGNSLFKQE